MRLRIVGADTLDNAAVLIHFSDGTSALFTADFLQASKDANGNKPIVEEEPE